MKHLMKLTCLAAAFLLLVGCGTGTGSGGTDTQTNAPTTTVPTQTESPYPEPDKLIALTFDDGPNAHMGTIIDVLADYDAKATFFVIGNKISDTSSGYIAQAYEAGHEIGNHSFSHTKLSEMTADQVTEDVEKTQALVENITGERPVWFRAPFLSTSDTMYDVIDMPFAGCAASAGDGSNDNLPEDRHYKVVNGAYDGAIVLLHCNDITAEVLPQILHDLKMQGYEFVTVSELYARTGEVPGKTPGVTYKDNQATE